MKEIKPKISSIFFSLLVINAAGFLLRFFDIEQFIIIFGFRFHISLALPFLLIFRRDHFEFYKKKLTDLKNRKHFLLFFITVFPLLLAGAVLFLFSFSEFGDPEYFYELGLSSIIDFPLYFIWNVPQLFMLLLFLYAAAEVSNAKSFNIFLTAFFLFAFYLIPLNESEFDYKSAASILFSAVIIAVLVRFYKNIYWSAAIIFFNLWGFILLFGTKSETLINILLAKYFTEWKGHLILEKSLQEFALPGFLFLWMIILLLFVPIVKPKN